MKRIIILFLSFCGFYQGAHAWEHMAFLDIVNTYGDLAYKKGTHCGIEQVYTHVPEGTEHKQPLLFIVVHGTYASANPDYYANYYTRVQVCAQQLACERKTPVKIIFYRWSGFNTPLARKEAGDILAKIINEHEGLEIITIAHSHGGTVVNYASNIIKNQIELMVHYAVPVIVENEIFRPSNFRLLCNFYSLTDIIQLIGAHSVTTALKESIKYSIASLAAQREYSAQTVGNNAGRVVNIRTRFHGYETDHSAIKNAIVVLPHVLDNLTSKYRLHDQLELNVDVTQKEYPILLMARTEKTENEDASQEASHSMSQKEIYKKQYGREIGAAPSRLSYFSEIVANTLLLIPTIRSLCSGYNFDKYVPHISHIKF